MIGFVFILFQEVGYKAGSHFSHFLRNGISSFLIARLAIASPNSSQAVIVEDAKFFPH
jgi:hypothetical protein